MSTQLETDLKFLLPFKNDSEYIDVKIVLADKVKIIKSFYEDFYTRPIPESSWKLNDTTLKNIHDYSDKVIIDWNIRNIKPFYEEFTVEKFWFKNPESDDNPYKDLKTEEGTIIGFKDGINTVFYKGDYLEGGEMYSERTKPILSKVQPSFFDTTPDNIKKRDSLSQNGYSKFLYAFFPPKLYLSNSKNYFILTQGKHLLRNREQPVIRFYFNLKPDKVDTTNIKLYEESVESFKSNIKKFINTIERFLNDRRIPFQFKLPISLENFKRADTFVLYVAQKHYYYLYEFLKKHAENYMHIFGEVSPLFTNQFGDFKGISIAEDPDITGDSFGINRATLIYNIIEKLSKIEGIKDKMTVTDIITELKNRGYKDEFYRNPYTRYNYKFDVPRTEINLSNSYPIDTKFYLYIYARVVLNYALDLIEKAIWFESTEMTWLTYYKDKDTKEKGYRLVDGEEAKLIFWFLKQILEFPWMRKHFPDNVIKIIITKNQPNDLDSRLRERIELLFEDSDSKEKYDEIKNNITKFNFSYEILWKRVKIYSKKIEEYSDTVFSVPEDDIIAKIYHLDKDKFDQEEELIQNARKIYYKYLKPLYPIKNFYNNYE